STCTDGITANVAFASDVPAANQSVTAIDSSDPNTTITLTRVAGTNTWQNLSAITVTPGDGQHAIAIQATQTAGTIGTTTCGTGGRNKPCTTLLGTRQQAFGACNGCGDPDESGPIVALRVRYPSPPASPPNDNPGASAENVFQAGSTQHLVFEVDVQGLH